MQNIQIRINIANVSNSGGNNKRDGEHIIACNSNVSFSRTFSPLRRAMDISAGGNLISCGHHWQRNHEIILSQ